MSPFGWEIFFPFFFWGFKKEQIVLYYLYSISPWFNNDALTEWKYSTVSHFQGSSHSIPDQNSSLLLQSWFSSPESAPGATEPSGNSYLNAFGHNFPLCQAFLIPLYFLSSQCYSAFKTKLRPHQPRTRSWPPGKTSFPLSSYNFVVSVPFIFGCRGFYSPYCSPETSGSQAVGQHLPGLHISFLH